MTEKIKIMFVSGALSFGGLERVIINLCKHVDRKYFEPVMVCIKSRGELAEEIEAIGVKLYVLNANKSRRAKYLSWLSLRNIIKNEDIKIIHSHNTAAFLDAVLASLFMPGRVLVHTDHARSFPDKVRYMLAEHMAAYRVKKIVAVSDELKNELMRYEKIPAGKIQVILNGIDGSSYCKTVDIECLKKKVLPRNYKNLIGLGVVLSEQKGIIHLIRAAPEILEQFPETGFLIAGDGPARQALETEVRKQGLSDNFVFLGFRKDIPVLLQLLDIYVFPSEWEGLPLAILEAMAARRCILSTNVGGIPRALSDNHNALLIPPKKPELIADKIVQLLSDDSLRQRLSDMAYQTFQEKFDVQIMVRSYENLYFQALGSQRSISVGSSDD
jgi:glycosyltransferase involved in cell wall biosynthesis